MIKKLFKQEFIYYLRTLIIFLPIILIFGIMTRIIVCFQTDEPVYYIVFGSSIVMLYIASIVCAVLTFILAIVRFYKNMFSSEGYLTFTLPISNTTHILVKLASALICSFASGCVIALSWIIVGTGFTDLLKEAFADIIFAFSQLNAVHLTFYGIEIVILLIVASIYSYLLYYACISIGQTAKKNRIFLAIGAYFIYYTIVQVAATIFMVIFTVLGVSDLLTGLGNFIVNHPYAFVHILFILFILGSAAIAFAFFKISLNIMNKKLNLE